MSKGEKKFVLFLLIIIIMASVSIMVQFKTHAEYNPQIYDEIYSEYNTIFEENVSEEPENNNSTNNTIANNNIENDDFVTNDSDNTSNNISNSEGTANNQVIDKEINGKKYKIIGKIQIPKIDIKYPIINTTTDEYLKVAPTKLTGPNINEVGNLCIVGHNYYNSQFFSRLNELNNGDKVFLTSVSGNSKTYYVYNKYEISENDLSCTNQETNGKIELTLITCVKNKKENRLVVKCKALE